jgi:hypothetical protein
VLFRSQQGSNPADGASPLRVQGFSAVVGANGALGTELHWQGLLGRQYSVLRADRLEGPFTPIATGLGGSAGPQVFQDPSPPTGGAFYRVRID